MSSKSAIQLIILIIIFIILGGVYLKYFSKEKIIVDQTHRQTEKEININSQNNNKNKDESESANSTNNDKSCLLYTSPSPRDKRQSRMPSSA